VKDARQKLADLIASKRGATTQAQLAAALGVSAGQVSRWERAVQIPALKILGRLADRLGVPQAALYELAAAAAQEEAREARQELSEVLVEVRRFVHQYKELGHTYVNMSQQVDLLVAEVAEIKQAVLKNVKTPGRPSSR
jgi:transcriptional regulator with XRE-family HTH domain